MHKTSNITGTTESLVMVGHDDKTGLRGLWQRSLQDLIAIQLPYTTLAAESVIVICYVYDPTMSFLLYSSLPEKFQNWFTLGICTLEEARLLVTLAGICVPVWQLQVIAFDLVNNGLEQMEQYLLKERRYFFSNYLTKTELKL